MELIENPPLIIKVDDKFDKKTDEVLKQD